MSASFLISHASIFTASIASVLSNNSEIMDPIVFGRLGGKLQWFDFLTNFLDKDALFKSQTDYEAIFGQGNA